MDKSHQINLSEHYFDVMFYWNDELQTHRSYFIHTHTHTKENHACYFTQFMIIDLWIHLIIFDFAGVVHRCWQWYGPCYRGNVQISVNVLKISKWFPVALIDCLERCSKRSLFLTIVNERSFLNDYMVSSFIYWSWIKHERNYV